MYMTAESCTPGAGDLGLNFTRLMRDWVEDEVSWNSRKADSTWQTPGALQTSSTIALFGGTAQAYEGTFETAVSDWTTRDTNLSFGTDSLYSGYAAGFSDPLDSTLKPFYYYFMDADRAAGYTDAPRWITLDITQWAQMTHAGAWAPYGFMIDETWLQTCTITVTAQDYTTDSALRPKLVVDYLATTSGSGGGGGATGGSGARR